MQDDTSPLETAINIVKQKEYPPSSRMNAILYMVEKYQPTECLTVFEDILRDPDEDPDVRSAAALALGKVGGDRALDLLKKMAQADDKTIKNYSIQGLGLLGREEGLPELLEALKDDDNRVFASAAEAIGKLGSPAVPHLINLLQKSNAEDIRCVAAWQLGTLRYAEAIAPLISVVKTDKNLELVALAIWALGEIGQDQREVLETLKTASAHGEPSISQRAEMAIKKITRHIN
ncbi:MAG TPA: HEAT repeat domain-containing protein [Oculatellaceae cyanobacterium]|jgi:HEAT repeat protein